MSKRIQVDTDPVNPLYFQIAKDIAEDPTSTTKERLMARMLGEIGNVVNKFLLQLEYGMMSVSDEPPDETKQFARKPTPGE